MRAEEAIQRDIDEAPTLSARRRFRMELTELRRSRSYRLPRWINWDAEPLGEISDAELAARIGVTRQAVARQRKKRGIPAL